MSVRQPISNLRRVFVAGALGLFAAVGEPAFAVTATFGDLYQEALSSACGGSAGGCSITFSPVPAGKRLVIQHASCKGRASSGAAITELRLYELNALGTGSSGLENILIPVTLANLASHKAWEANETVAVLVGVGRRARIQLHMVSPADALSLSCSITGTLIPSNNI